nr:hypothetical protein [uncultured Flavobacterium sp.]
MKNIQKTIGLILLFPPVLSVLLFSINLLLKESGTIVRMYNLSGEWSGNMAENSGGYMSATPIYFGLMAIAGALLIKDSDKK